MTTTPAGPAPHPIPSGTMSATPQATVTVPAPPHAGTPSFRPFRVSDAEREQVAVVVRAAAGSGRLTLTEADERQAAAYAARSRDELVPLVADLPAPEPAPLPGHHPYGRLTPRAVRRLRLHLAVVGVLAAVMLTGWVLGPARWFWPAGPVFWMLVTVAVHRRLAERDTGSRLGA